VFFVKSAGIGRPSPLVAGRPILSATPRRGTDCRDAIADWQRRARIIPSDRPANDDNAAAAALR